MEQLGQEERLALLMSVGGPPRDLYRREPAIHEESQVINSKHLVSDQSKPRYAIESSDMYPPTNAPSCYQQRLVLAGGFGPDSLFPV